MTELESTAKNILVVYAFWESHGQWRLELVNHLHALDLSPNRNNIIYFNAFEDYPYWDLFQDDAPEIPTSLQGISFDAVILHRSFLCYRWGYLDPQTLSSMLPKIKSRFSWIADFVCPKIANPQDEYDHASILDEWLYEWNVSAVLSCFGKKAWEILYPLTSQKAAMYSCLTGYIDEKAAQEISRRLLPLSHRAIDIIYRAHHLPYYLGSAGQMKWIVGDRVNRHPTINDLNIDISTDSKDVIYEGWLDFLASGKATLGVESGASAIDWRGEVRAKERALRIVDPSLTFEQFKALMDPGWDDHRFLTVSPRHFEAVITKTCQILVEGEYRDILKPDVHYIPLKKDFSNLEEALDKLRDVRYVEAMVERAYEDIYLSGRYSYRTFAELIERAISDTEQSLQKKSRKVK